VYQTKKGSFLGSIGAPKNFKRTIEEVCTNGLSQHLGKKITSKVTQKRTFFNDLHDDGMK
jgi:hypothetical protein